MKATNLYWFMCAGILAIPVSGIPCEPLPGYREFQTNPGFRNPAQAPPSPEIKLGEVIHGFSEERVRPCHDAGMVEILVTESIHAGYIIRATGPASEMIRLPTTPVAPTFTNPGRLRFYWVDDATAGQEPIELRMVVQPVTAGGLRGQPVEFHINRSGKP